MKYLPCLLLFAALAACGRRESAPLNLPPADCNELYALLPENYIIDIQAEAEVFLNPARHEFIVFCAAEEAARAREKALKQGLLSKKANWRIYKLAGDPREIAQTCHERALCLSREAQAIDWLPETEGE